MAQSHILGFPRIGSNRELKKTIEAYWRQEVDANDLQQTATEIRKRNWQWQQEADLSVITVGDFSFYDNILDLSVALGNVPSRYQKLIDTENALDTQFIMARGRTASGIEAPACSLTKWFDTNYHYIVPEFEADTQLKCNAQPLLQQIKEAQAYGHVKVVLPGIITYLWLGREKTGIHDRLELLERFVPVYQELINQITSAGIAGIEIDEPALVTDLPASWVAALKETYATINFGNVKTVISCFFDAPSIPLEDYFALPFDAFHIDFTRADITLRQASDLLPKGKVLSAGVVNGRNIWKTDIQKIVDDINTLNETQQDHLMIASSCSLLHVPFDLNSENKLDPDVKNWLAFARQKLEELQAITAVVNNQADALQVYLQENAAAIASRKASSKVHNPAVQQAIANLDAVPSARKTPFEQRKAQQDTYLDLPPLPTTTIGSFPQTQAIRTMRSNFKKGTVNSEEYRAFMENEIQQAIAIQEEIGLDVLVHGESERNDMVEYFGEQLAGFTFTENGWVQSYGSRCVKPPIIFGDISRPTPMTIDWATFAQKQTDKIVKGMLTGPVTILQWSFVRDDQPRQVTCEQIALTILEEVQDLEKNGIRVIQIDEPAIREGLPLQKAKQAEYLNWSARAFRLATSDIADQTQIHTHMCYSEFNEIIEDIIALDADVISIETSRSHMQLLDIFTTHKYPNEIGPGVYDIHSPRTPTVEEMVVLLQEAAKRIDVKKLWVNPDCGLKTRTWAETKPALENMVKAAIKARAILS